MYEKGRHKLSPAGGNVKAADLCRASSYVDTDYDFSAHLVLPFFSGNSAEKPPMQPLAEKRQKRG